MKKLSKNGKYYHFYPSETYNSSWRDTGIDGEGGSVFEFTDIENCTVIPKDVFINATNSIIDNVLHMKKQLYSAVL